MQPVKLYIKLGCVACVIVKRKLDQLGVQYTEIIGDGDGKPVPRIEVDGKTITLTRFVNFVKMNKEKKAKGMSEDVLT